MILSPSTATRASRRRRDACGDCRGTLCRGTSAGMTPWLPALRGRPGRDRGLHWSRFLCQKRVEARTGPHMDIMDEVRQVIANTLKVPIDQLKPDSRLDDLGAES